LFTDALSLLERSCGHCWQISWEMLTPSRNSTLDDVVGVSACFFDVSPHEIRFALR